MVVQENEKDLGTNICCYSIDVSDLGNDKTSKHFNSECINSIISYKSEEYNFGINVVLLLTVSQFCI